MKTGIQLAVIMAIVGCFTINCAPTEHLDISADASFSELTYTPAYAIVPRDTFPAYSFSSDGTFNHLECDLLDATSCSTIETATLSTDNLADLTALITAADLLTQSDQTVGGCVGASGMSYSLTNNDGDENEVTYTGFACDGSITPTGVDDLTAEINTFIVRYFGIE